MATKVQRFENGTLTPKDKLEILVKTKEVLGRGGKNWIKGIWFGKKLGDNFEAGTMHGYEDVADAGTAKTVAAKADCFCLEGAIEYAAYKLGYTDRLVQDDRAARKCSLAGLIEKETKHSVNGFNDQSTTKWGDIKKRLDKRIKQVLKEIG